MKKTGAYLPGAYEEVVEIVDAYVLTEKVGNKVNLRIKLNFTYFIFEDKHSGTNFLRSQFH